MSVINPQGDCLRLFQILLILLQFEIITHCLFLQKILWNLAVDSSLSGLRQNDWHLKIDQSYGFHKLSSTSRLMVKTDISDLCYPLFSFKNTPSATRDERKARSFLSLRVPLSAAPRYSTFNWIISKPSKLSFEFDRKSAVISQGINQAQEGRFLIRTASFGLFCYRLEGVFINPFSNSQESTISPARQQSEGPCNLHASAKIRCNLGVENWFIVWRR